MTAVTGTRLAGERCQAGGYRGSAHEPRRLDERARTTLMARGMPLGVQAPQLAHSSISVCFMARGGRKNWGSQAGSLFALSPTDLSAFAVRQSRPLSRVLLTRSAPWSHSRCWPAPELSWLT